jgi:hypothetical protein
VESPWQQRDVGGAREVIQMSCGKCGTKKAPAKKGKKKKK